MLAIAAAVAEADHADLAGAVGPRLQEPAAATKSSRVFV